MIAEDPAKTITPQRQDQELRARNEATETHQEQNDYEHGTWLRSKPEPIGVNGISFLLNKPMSLRRA